MSAANLAAVFFIVKLHAADLFRSPSGCSEVILGSHRLLHRELSCSQRRGEFFREKLGALAKKETAFFPLVFEV